jgi:hypothetical protein
MAEAFCTVTDSLACRQCVAKRPKGRNLNVGVALAWGLWAYKEECMYSANGGIPLKH